jgi:hypothetical protein
MDAKRSIYECIAVPNLLYGTEVCARITGDRRRMGVMEIKCMRGICAVSIMDIVRNEEVRRRCSVLSIGERMDINVLMRYGHVERRE